jgi:spermidine dehydrogenase
MAPPDDRTLGMHRRIARRDFLNGASLAITGSLLPPALAAAAREANAEAAPYPPALTGMRGSHPGSFEVAHALRDGGSFGAPTFTGESYDLIVVGRLSGLAAASRRSGPHRAHPPLDNHDGGRMPTSSGTDVFVGYGGR